MLFFLRITHECALAQWLDRSTVDRKCACSRPGVGTAVKIPFGPSGLLAPSPASFQGAFHYTC